MKWLLILILSLSLPFCCDAQKGDVIVQYTAVKRGTYIKIEAENRKVSIIKSREEAAKDVKLSKREWKVLVANIRKIDLENLKDLKAPSEKRLYDGAATANLEITLEGKKYWTSGFDHGFPPAEIKEVVDFLMSLNKN